MKLLNQISFPTIVSFLVFGLIVSVVGFNIQKTNTDSRTKAVESTSNGILSFSGSQMFQLSYWVDINLRKGVRGYWKKYTSIPSEQNASESEIRNAKQILRTTYHANQLYIVYHRQMEIDQVKQQYLEWKKSTIQNSTYAPIIIPALVLQDYETHACNFSDAELIDLVTFLRTNINDKAIALFDIYNIQSDTKRNFCNQTYLVKHLIGPKAELIRLGLQPNEQLHWAFDKAVEDTYGGVSSGQTNVQWQNQCGIAGKPSARLGLTSWIDERVNNSKVAWNFIVVAFDYSKNIPCGSDNFELGDVPLAAGRNRLVHDLIVSRYPGGGAHKNWTGFSSDLLVLNWSSIYKDAGKTNFYETLRAGIPYTGYFKIPLDEIAQIYDLYD